MKPRNREVNIFNMSVLDLLTGALGAFCFLTLALFPSYYKNQGSSNEPASPGKAGIPPFSIEQLWTLDDQFRACGGIKLKDIQAPHGRKSYSQVPMRGERTDGYNYLVHLFLYDPGSYRMTITGYGNSPTCALYFAQDTPQGNYEGKTTMTGSPTDYSVAVEVKRDQLITGIAPHR